MIATLGTPENVVFVGALVLMGLIGLVEALGLGGSAIELHFGADVEAGDLLSWLGIGRLPLLIVLVIFLAVFGLSGLALQQIAAGNRGAPLSPWFAVPLAVVLALPLSSLAARGLARVLPRDETTAVELDTLVGRFATVLVGRAAVGSPARARVEDHYGQAHFIMVEPESATERFGEGDAVLLVRREGHVFRGLGRGDALLPTLD